MARQGVLPLGSLTVALFIHSFIHFTSFIWSFIPGWTLRYASLHFTFVQFHVLCTNPISCWPFSGCLLQQSFLLFFVAAAVTSCLSQHSSCTCTQAQSQSQFVFRLRFSPFPALFFLLTWVGGKRASEPLDFWGPLWHKLSWHSWVILGAPPQSQSVWTTSYANKTIDSKWNSEMQRFPTNKQTNKQRRLLWPSICPTPEGQKDRRASRSVKSKKYLNLIRAVPPNNKICTM